MKLVKVTLPVNNKGGKNLLTAHLAYGHNTLCGWPHEGGGKPEIDAPICKTCVKLVQKREQRLRADLEELVEFMQKEGI